MSRNEIAKEIEFAQYIADRSRKAIVTTDEMIPERLKRGDTIRVIAPSRSLSLIGDSTRAHAIATFESMGLQVTYGKNVLSSDDFYSSSITERLEDLHDAFRDPQVKGIITVIGGFNSNQLLRSIDYELIRDNPMILCGYSDITALANAIYAKTNLVTYSGPHFSTFGCKEGMEFTLDHFKRCLFTNEPIEIGASAKWADDRWWENQDNRTFLANQGWNILSPGHAKGTLIGGNLCTLNLLQGTEFMPSLESSILFIEDDEVSNPVTFDRDLQSLIHQPGFAGVKGIAIGRFQLASRMTASLLRQIISSKPELHWLPIIADVDFGHTQPMITFPIGGTAEILSDGANSRIVLLEH